MYLIYGLFSYQQYQLNFGVLIAVVFQILKYAAGKTNIESV
jgi:hypothetical protein